MAVWDNIKNRKFTILRTIQCIAAWGIAVVLLTFHDGICLRWKYPGSVKASCDQWSGDALAYTNWVGAKNVYPEIGGQLFVCLAGIFCGVTSFFLALSTVKCLRPERFQGGASSIPLMSGQRVRSGGIVQDYASALGQSIFVKVLLVFCTLLMLTAGPLEIWYATGFGRGVKLPPFVGTQGRWFGSWALSAVLCFLSAILYIVDFVLGMRGQKNI